MKALLLLLSLALFSAQGAKPASVFLTDSGLKKSYLDLLKQAGDFHTALAKKDQKAIQKEIRETQEIIARLNRKIGASPFLPHSIHSHKLLNAIEEQLAGLRFNKALNKAPEREKKNIKKLFNSFFELAQVYNLKDDIKNKVFYCAKDKSLWFQSEGKAQNPISSHYKNCGQRIL